MPTSSSCFMHSLKKYDNLWIGHKTIFFVHGWKIRWSGSRDWIGKKSVLNRFFYPYTGFNMSPNKQKWRGRGDGICFHAMYRKKGKKKIYLSTNNPLYLERWNKLTKDKNIFWYVLLVTAFKAALNVNKEASFGLR